MATSKSFGSPRFGRFAALSTTSGLVLAAALMAQPALAQTVPAAEDTADADKPTPVETAEESTSNEIVVTGYRASLQNAQGVKRRADTVVDVISAEDIGALPDRSVAEALQRVPGVNIGRFEKPSDPDRFSVEGTGVIIRGLPYVRSELNGRDIFSANGGIVLSFNDVSPELLGRVEVFKNATSDMIEGSIAGTVNLVTRKPLDRSGTHLAGSVEMNYGDLRKKWSPTFNVLGSTTVETGAGRLGFQLGYSNSELKSRTDASQIGDPCYRAPSLNGDCIRAVFVNSGGFGNAPNFDASNFPPAGSVLVPEYAGVRTTTLDRKRNAWNATLQYEDPTGDFVVTAEWLRSETTFATEEYALIGRRDDPTTPVIEARDSWQYDNSGKFVSGILTQGAGNAYASPFGLGGVPVDSLRFLRDTKSVTSDYSFDVKWNVSDRLRLKFEAQRVESDLRRDSVFGAMSTWADIGINLAGNTPQIQFLAPPGAPADYFSSGFYTYYWFGLDSREKNDGKMDTLRFDAEYDINDTGFFKKASFGARWSDRDRTTRNTDFSTWGNLSAPWAGRAGCAPWGSGPTCPFVPGRFYTGLPGQEFAIAGGAYTDDFPAYSQLRNPFGSNFQRGAAPTPIPNGQAWFYGGDDFLKEYLSGVTDGQWDQIATFSQTPNAGNLGVNGRTRPDPLTGVAVPCNIEGVYCPNEISTVGEITKSAYARIDFGHEFSSGWNIVGNFGLRFVQTEVASGGRIGFPDAGQFDRVVNGGNGDGVVQVSEIDSNCAGPGVPGQVRGYCDLSAARRAEFAAAFTGEILNDNRKIRFDHWLPSFNAKLDVGDGLLFRFAVSKGISRPDLQLFAAGGFIGDNTAALKTAGANALETGPLFILNTGNRNLRPVTSWNYDLSAEWYFSKVGSLTAAVFYKDIKGRVDTGFTDVVYTTKGTPVDVVVKGPANSQDGKIKGFELAYQQTYDFLPGLLSGLGSQITYTYVDGSDLTNANLANPGEPSVTTSGEELFGGSFAFQQPLAGLSKHTINATLFYEKGPLAIRAAYNWRSAFLITPRDDIYPFSPIWQEASGQLDASIFYAVNKHVKIGVQGVNLLDEVTRTSQVVDFSGTRFPRSAFRNDRRYTFLARFDF